MAKQPKFNKTIFIDVPADSMDVADADGYAIATWKEAVELADDGDYVVEYQLVRVRRVTKTKTVTDV